MNQKEEWKDIPGYDGWYQISTEGRVRSYRKGKGHKNSRWEDPKVMSPELWRNRKSGRTCLRIKLTSPNGKRINRYMTTLMADTWIGPRKPGYSVCTKNNNPADVRLSNLCIMKTSDITRLKIKGPKSFCKKLPVIKIDRSLEVVDAYPSARQAALAAGFDRVTISRYCNREFKQSIIAPDGFIYAWDDARMIWATLKRAMRELDELGMRYNNPFTGRYFDLPPDDGLGIDVNVGFDSSLWRGGGQLRRERGVML